MAKLYFRYGAMNSGKSTALMQVAHNYEEQGMKVLILKPQVDTKGGGELVSRLGVRRKADLLIPPELDVFEAVQAAKMKTICTCGRKAICNCRKVNGRFVFEGEQVAIDLENDVQYVSMCPQCYFKARRAFYAARKN